MRRPALREPTGENARGDRPGDGRTDLTVRGQVSEQEADEVLGLADAAAASDAVAPLSEDVRLHVRYGGDPTALNLLLYRDGSLAGFAHLDPADPAHERSGELAVHPAWRRRGLGGVLVRALVTRAGTRPLRIWAHGDLPAAARLASAAGFARARSLWQMRATLGDPVEMPRMAGGVSVRTFVPGRDEAAWLRLNARAFADHPEQGRWAREDLDRREGEPWFDPAGFFLAERRDGLAGFHWTKIHSHAGQSPPLGEVYVIGVDPAERGTGLGRALTLMGLRHLRERGIREVMLYVDESNTAAIRLYESLGFTRTGADVMYRYGAGP